MLVQLSLWFILMVHSVAMAQDEDLELQPAESLDESQALQSPSQPQGGWDLPFRYRGYLGLGYDELTVRQQQTHETYVIGSFNLTGEHPQGLGSFLDVSAGLLRSNQDTTQAAVINQLGLRWRFQERFLVVVGKERNRRAPGLVYSPSDFLHTTQPVPGALQDGTGRWMTRLAYQTLTWTLDCFYLPVAVEKTNGMPDQFYDEASGMVSLYSRMGGVEGRLSAGRWAGVTRIGTDLQGFIADPVKIYGEWGYEQQMQVFYLQRKHAVSALFGATYEGIADTILTVEYFHLPAYLSEDELQLSAVKAVVVPSQFFVRQKYLLANISVSEIFDRAQVYVTAVSSLEGRDTLGIVYVAYHINDSLSWGASAMAFDNSHPVIKRLRPMSQKISTTLTWSF